MPTWLLLLLVIAGLVLWTALLAAGHTGRWRTIWEAAKQFSTYLLLLALPAILAGVWLFMNPPTP